MKTFFDIEVFSEDPSFGYNFPFILLKPKKLNKNVKILVEGNNSVHYIKENNKNVQTFDEQMEEAIEYAKSLSYINDGKIFNAPYFYQLLNQPIILPVIERCDKEHNGEYYTQMLGRNVILDKNSKFAHLNKQILKMIEKVKTIYTQKGIRIMDKAGLVGISTSGVFAGRLAFIEPESFDFCLSVCSNAVQPLPVDEINGIRLPYPIGTADYKELFNKEFNLKAYSKINQLFIVGKEEDNNRYNIAKNPRLHDREIQDIFIKVYGDLTIQQRQKFIDIIMQELDMKNTNCIVAPGGHSWKDKGNIIMSFLNSYITKSKR